MLVSDVVFLNTTCQSNITWLTVSTSMSCHFQLISAQTEHWALHFPAFSPPIILCVSLIFDVTLTGVNTDADMTNQLHTSNTSSPPRAPGFPRERTNVNRRHQPRTSLPVCLQSRNQTAGDEILNQTQRWAATRGVLLGEYSICVWNKFLESAFGIQNQGGELKSYEKSLWVTCWLIHLVH